MDQKQTGADEGRKNTLLFAQLIEILTQNAVMMLGGMPDRQGRSRPPDLNAAEMMIDMLAVLQKKTKGNLTKEEERMISGTLYQLQTAFADVASKSGDFEKARKATESMDAADAAPEGFEDDLEHEQEHVHGPGCSHDHEHEHHHAPPSGQQRPPQQQQQQQSPQRPGQNQPSRPASSGGSSAEQTERESKVKFTKKYG